MTRLSQSKNGADASIAFRGVEFAHFMGGVDFRLDRVFGLGPFVDFSLGEYTGYLFSPGEYSSDEPPDRSYQDIPEKALHEWLMLGIRGVFFP